MLCNYCGSLCSKVHGGRSDVNNHLGSKKHKVAVEAAASSSRVTSFFKDVGSASVASNMKEVKLVPIVVRYFLPESGVKVKLLEFKSVPGETAKLLSEYLLSVLD